MRPYPVYSLLRAHARVLTSPAALVAVCAPVAWAALLGAALVGTGLTSMTAVTVAAVAGLCCASPLLVHAVCAVLHEQRTGVRHAPRDLIAVAAQQDLVVAGRWMICAVPLAALGAVFFGFGLLVTVPWWWALLAAEVIDRRRGVRAVLAVRDSLSIAGTTYVACAAASGAFLAATAALSVGQLLPDLAPLVVLVVLWAVTLPAATLAYLAGR